MRLLLLDVPGCIVVQHAIGEPIWAHGDLAHTGLGCEPGALRQGLGPVGNVHTGFGPLLKTGKDCPIPKAIHKAARQSNQYDSYTQALQRRHSPQNREQYNEADRYPNNHGTC